jgi:2-polyprenyl-3-methyl-5-hydroxy-6-metoxy-1,4-benzoquinol methylase
MTTGLSNEQQVMERRFALPYNWLKGDHTRHVRQKNGLWSLALSCAGDLKGSRVLDAGCGDGWYSEKMVREGAVVSGIDYSERAIAFARDILPTADFQVASITALPFADETFDVSFSFQVIEHLPPDQVPHAIAELVRVTKRGGKIIVSVPSVVRPKSAAHYQHFTEASLRDLFKAFVSQSDVYGQERHTPALWFVERFIQNRIWTLEALGVWFNRVVFPRLYNRTATDKGYNLVFAGTRSST